MRVTVRQTKPSGPRFVLGLHLVRLLSFCIPFITFAAKDVEIFKVDIEGSDIAVRMQL